ncbi:MAG TPA: TIGR04211 family SH3 domain-containing protein [Gammaproteobacteria bacterium]|nr:TIGR04211 family SH3 domain-containing protein [Gammaproteobacteria bacterium]
MKRACMVMMLGLAVTATGAAETVYVTDKLLVGVHADKTVDSPILKVFPSGTTFEVLKREGDFAQVKGPEGITGWVDSSYITSDQPAAAVVQMLESKNKDLEENLKTAEAKAADLDAKLKAAPAAPGGANKPASDQQIDKLRKDNDDLQKAVNAERGKTADLLVQINKLKSQQPPPAGNADDKAVLDRLQLENEELKDALKSARTQAAGAKENSAGNAAGGASSFISRGMEPLLAIGGSPRVWGIILIVLLLGSFGGGAYFIDYLHRKRHGGFRL